MVARSQPDALCSPLELKYIQEPVSPDQFSDQFYSSSDADVPSSPTRTQNRKKKRRSRRSSNEFGADVTVVPLRSHSGTRRQQRWDNLVSLTRHTTLTEEDLMLFTHEDSAFATLLGDRRCLEIWHRFVRLPEETQLRILEAVA